MKTNFAHVAIYIRFDKSLLLCYFSWLHFASVEREKTPVQLSPIVSIATIIMNKIK